MTGNEKERGNIQRTQIIQEGNIFRKKEGKKKKKKEKTRVAMFT